MKQIVCVDSKNMIGRDGDQLVYIPEDLRYFKEKTSGKTIIVGQNTIATFPKGKPLPNRKNIVLSRDESLCIEGATVYNSIEEMLKYVDINDEDVYVVGGAQIYEQMLDYCDTLYITMIDADLDGTVSYPKYWERGFVKVIEDVVLDYDGIKYRHTVWKK